MGAEYVETADSEWVLSSTESDGENIIYNVIAPQDDYISRQWGNYSTVYESKVSTAGTMYQILTKDDTANVKVKILTIEPGKELSVQYHNSRAEKWVVLQGQGICIVEDSVRIIRTGDVVDISIKDIHSLRNAGEYLDLIILEIQMGKETIEGDIKRLKETIDTYKPMKKGVLTKSRKTTGDDKSPKIYIY